MVFVFPGEQLRLAVAPTEPGLFMYHCHNLEHEDGGMMRNVWFGPYYGQGQMSKSDGSVTIPTTI